MGSLKTDRNFNVVDEQAEPIAGLYAVGVEGAMIWGERLYDEHLWIVRRPQYLLGSHGRSARGGDAAVIALGKVPSL